MLEKLPSLTEESPLFFMTQSLMSADSQLLPSPLELLDHVLGYESAILDLGLCKIGVHWKGEFRAVFLGFLERWYLIGRPLSSSGVCYLGVGNKGSQILVQLAEEIEASRAEGKQKDLEPAKADTKSPAKRRNKKRR